jgi:hypothetical protein
MATVEKTRRLPVSLTSEETRARSSQLAAIVFEIDRTEAAMKNAATSYKEKIKELNADARILAKAVHTGKELREVDVYERTNAGLRTWETVRDDLAEVVASRPMTDLEVRDLLQGKLFDKERRPKKKDEAAVEGGAH